MTINVVNMELLSDKMLRNEQRDLCHVIAFVVNNPGCKTIDSLNYVVGKGHMTFFRNKLLWVLERLETVSIEMLDRGLVSDERCEEIIDHYNELLSDSYCRLKEEGLLNDWFVSAEDMQINVKEINLHKDRASAPWVGQPSNEKLDKFKNDTAALFVCKETSVHGAEIKTEPPAKPAFMTNWNAFVGNK